MKDLAMPYDCYIGLGANLGDREASIRTALHKIDELNGVKVLKVSSFYETEPWGNLEQPPFLNAVACLKVNVEPIELLKCLQNIENELGRVRHEHWGARTLDLDILYIPDYCSRQQVLQVPHPYMLERAFVLIPLSEIESDLMLKGKTIKEYCQKVQGKDGVKFFKSFHNI